jgi:CheY-like chemotaxis protein
VPKTLLAVDDSATMRKVLEITFASDDFRVVTADSAATALGSLGEDPAAAVLDASLGGDDTYALAKEMRTRNPRLAILLMVSRYNPYDPNRGRDAGVDDFIDKPFDTQMFIDKVKKALTTREQARPAAPAPVAAPPPAPPAAFTTTASFGGAPRTAGPTSTAAAPPAPAAKPGWNPPRTHTLSFEGALPIVPAPIISPSSAPMPRPASTATASHVHAPSVVSPSPAAPIAYAPPAASRSPEPPATVTPSAPLAGNGQFGKKLGELGLSAAQADAVLALSRDLVEKVVWEVVPQIAEAIIREEIARLTKEG